MKHQVAAIQDGDWKEVHEAHGGRNERDEPDKVARTEGGHGARRRRNPHRARQIAGADDARDDVPKAIERADDDKSHLTDSACYSRPWAQCFCDWLEEGAAAQADPVIRFKPAAGLAFIGRARLQREVQDFAAVLGRAPYLERERLALGACDGLDHVVKDCDRGAIDAEHNIARLDTCVLRGAVDTDGHHERRRGMRARDGQAVAVADHVIIERRRARQRITQPCDVFE